MDKTLVPTQAELAEQVAREFVIRVHDHLGKGRAGQASLWSHVYPQFKDELREIANDVANTVVRTTPNLTTAVEDEREACAKVAESQDIYALPDAAGMTPGQAFEAGMSEAAYQIMVAIRTRPPTLPDDRDAVLPWATLRDIVTPPPFWHNEAAWTVMARLVVAALSKHDRNEGGDPPVLDEVGG